MRDLNTFIGLYYVVNNQFTLKNTSGTRYYILVIFCYKLLRGNLNIEI